MSDVRGYDPDGNPVTESDLRDMFDDMLTDVYGDVMIGGLEHDHGSVMRDVDPVAYRCGLNDYWDSLEDNGYTEDPPEDDES